MEITGEDIARITSHMSIIHHTKGRLRVRVSSKIKDENEEVSIKDIEALSEKIDGIKKIKINKLLGSITVLYDHEIFSYEIWEDLIAGEKHEDAVKKINTLYKEVI